MNETGLRNGAFGADKFGFRKLAGVHWNDGAAVLVERAVARGEAKLTAHGAVAAETGQHTGRSAKDKFVVRDAETDPVIWWDNNAAIEPEKFDILHEDMLAFAEGMELHGQDLYGGADPDNRIRVRVYTDYAWHALFIRYMLIRPERAALEDFVPQ
ncbi:MAG: phosphoenolpyruvate carboxykinase (ATP), partial [Flavobacteriaceae bacterium]